MSGQSQGTKLQTHAGINAWTLHSDEQQNTVAETTFPLFAFVFISNKTLRCKRRACWKFLPGYFCHRKMGSSVIFAESWKEALSA